MIQLDIFLNRFPLDQLKRRGTDCPFCGRQTKAYGYDLDKKLIQRLITIADHTNLSKDSWWPKEVFGKTDTEFNKLKYWGLIEKVKSKWRLTGTGIRFLQKQIIVPKKVWVYDDTTISKDDELVNIEMVEPRWKYLAEHWHQDFIVPPLPKQERLLV